MANQNSYGIKKAVQNVAAFFTPFAAQRKPPRGVNYREPAKITTLSTGCRPVDKALGIGGLPCGKLTELMGPIDIAFSGGTACIAAHIASKVQRQQELVTIVDMDRSFDPWQAERCGLAAPHLFLIRPDTIFSALTTLERAAQNTALVIVMMGLVTDLLAEVEPDLLKTLLHRLNIIIKRSPSVFLFLTAPRENNPYSPANYPVGFPLAELADVRLWVQDETWTHKDGLTKAYKANLTVIKNELAMPGLGATIRVKFTRNFAG